MNKSLNTFRALAFLGVFLFHSNINRFGYLGILAFFVLSGYLITPILLKTKKHTASFKDFIKNFYGRRALRIFPAYYLYILIVTLIIFIGKLQNQGDYSVFIHQLPYTISYTYDFYHASHYFQDNELATHFWTLAVEEQFYIFWPLVIYFCSEKHLKNLMIYFIFAGPIIRFLIGLVIDHHLIGLLGTNKTLIVYVLPFSHIDAFLIGGFFSLYIRQYTPNNLTIFLSSAGILLIGLITSKISTNQYCWHALGYLPFMNDSYKYIWGYSLFSVYFGLILLRLNKRNFMKPLFENNIMNYLGKISYGLYIYHYFILHLVTYFNLRYHILIALILTIIVSILSFELFEKPLLKFKDKLFPVNRKNTNEILVQN